MKKFSQISKSKIRRINEADETIGQNIQQFANQGQPQVQVQAQGQPQQGQQQQQQMPAANLPQNIQQTNTSGEQQPEPVAESGSVSNFFSKLFESREMAHIYHLQIKDTGSYAGHMALNDYYEGVIDHIDNLIETYQGQYGLVEEYDVIDTKDTTSKDKIQYFEELASFIKEQRTCIISEDTHLHNIIDEIVALLYRTLYKLKNLK